MHCHRFQPLPLTRREMLGRCAGGFGSIALAALMGQESQAAAPLPAHRSPRAKHILFLYMDGGVSQVDSFDPKPRLNREHGQPFTAKREPTQFNNVGTIFGCPWKFAQHGESGLWVSELFPHVARCADRLTVVRSMVSEFSEHNTANYFLHTGLGQPGRPSWGAWLSYGLGTEASDLPAFAVINGGLVPSGGLENFSAGFLPARHQATLFKPQAVPIANLQPPISDTPQQLARQRSLLAELDKLCTERFSHADAIESAIANYELAYRMQTAVPELANIDDEPEYLKRLYGLDHAFEPTRIFARECLLARRMIERGVRCIELTCPRTEGNDRWDAHSDLVKNHSENARMVDQPIAALLEDLAARGLLDEMLVVWAGEFGRTPFAQGSNGRDHNPFGFTIWLAGGGVRPGIAYGATDDYGYRVVENRTTVYDLHATLLHLLGLDHERLTFRFGGRDMRLTDVHGEVVREILS